MQFANKKNITNMLWAVVGIAVIILFGAAVNKKHKKLCEGVLVEMFGQDQNICINKKDIIKLINTPTPITSKELKEIDLRALELSLEQNIWINDAEMYLDNNNLLHVQIEERIPVARIFTVDGNSFYIDSSGIRLPLCHQFSTHVPVFTNFPSDKPILSHPDSSLLLDVKNLANFIYADSFWTAQIGQIYITSEATFELVPVVGNQLIVLGKAENFEDKMNRMMAFYQQAFVKNGVNTYEKFDVRFDNQVVATRRGMTQSEIDSTKLNQIINSINEKSKLDSLNKSFNIKNILKDTAHSNKIKKPSQNAMLPINLSSKMENKVENNTLSVKHTRVNNAK